MYLQVTQLVNWCTAGPYCFVSVFLITWHACVACFFSSIPPLSSVLFLISFPSHLSLFSLSFVCSCRRIAAAAAKPDPASRASPAPTQPGCRWRAGSTGLPLHAPLLACAHRNGWYGNTEHHALGTWRARLPAPPPAVPPSAPAALL